MAGAESHGAAAAAGTNTNNHHSTSDSNSRHRAPPSPSVGRNDGDTSRSEERTGLLAAGPDAAGDLEDDDYNDYNHDHGHDNDNDDEGMIVHPGEPETSTVAQPRLPRTARTPNRVRFDLRPTFVDRPGTESESDESVENDYRQHPPPRDSFDIDDEDPLSSSSSSSSSSSASRQQRRHQQQRVPLLTDIEAPSVTVATTALASSAGDGPLEDPEEARARPRSSLPAAFMNMANSIIGAGIIGQPYAFRQAGLLAGALLLVALTAVVDWTIRLIVVNTKLCGARSFQGTVEKCFGRPGLVAISLAQWAFAFGGMVAFGVIVGDSIPHVLRAVWPGLPDMPVLGLLADRRAVIVVFTLGISYPLALYRDIAKVSPSRGSGGTRVLFFFPPHLHANMFLYISWPRRARWRW